MTDILTDEQEFRSLVLVLKKQNPSWGIARNATELQSYENTPELSRDALRRKINRALKRGTIKDKPGRGAKRTITTDRFKKNVKKLIHLKKGQNPRKVVVKLQSKGVPCKRTSVRKAIKELKLKPFKRRKAQKLSEANKIKRINCSYKFCHDYILVFDYATTL